MYRIIFLIMLFLLIVYVYSFLKIRRNKRKRETELSFVEQYHQKRFQDKASEYRQSGPFYSKGGNVRNYVTKYNSPVDYIEKRKEHDYEENN